MIREHLAVRELRLNAELRTKVLEAVHVHLIVVVDVSWVPVGFSEALSAYFDAVFDFLSLEFSNFLLVLSHPPLEFSVLHFFDVWSVSLSLRTNTSLLSCSISEGIEAKFSKNLVHVIFFSMSIHTISNKF